MRIQYEPSSVAELPFNDAGALYTCVTGTHSSGKTELLTQYSDSNQPLGDLFGDYDALFEGVNFGFSAVYHEVEGVIIPSIVVPETMTQYLRWWQNPHIATDQYTFMDQIAVELRSTAEITSAGLFAARAARLLQPNTKNPVSVVISDRGPLDGYAYSSLRFPDIDQENVDISAAAQKSGNFVLAAPGSQVMKWRELCRAAMRARSAGVFVCDHTEIVFEDNGARLASETFRTAVDEVNTAYYLSVVGAERLHYLRGNPQTRLALFTARINQLISQQLAV